MDGWMDDYLRVIEFGDISELPIYHKSDEPGGICMTNEDWGVYGALLKHLGYVDDYPKINI